MQSQYCLGLELKSLKTVNWGRENTTPIITKDMSKCQNVTQILAKVGTMSAKVEIILAW